MSSNVVIVYHSGYGHTQKVAEAVAAGSGGKLLPIDAEGNLSEGGKRWTRLLPSCLAARLIWAT